VLAAANVTAASLTDEGRAAMGRHFVTTSRYEWMFWDMGYRIEQWPV
jgi:thiaminase (transcriptional activator TenA)